MNRDVKREELLKSYLKRLDDGEALEAVRADFVKEFASVSPQEIMVAEEALIKEGTPVASVQKLCDLHSVLFHGKIQEELAKRDSFPKQDYSDKNAKAAKLEAIKGHPLQLLTDENRALEKFLKEYAETKDKALLEEFKGLSIHYAKKGDLIYPLLKVKYGVSGPSDVMWTVDDEIRDDFGRLMKEPEYTEEWNEKMDQVLKRAEEMIYKEQNILFPICAVNFTEEEWFGIYHDLKDFDRCFDVDGHVWEDAESYERPLPEATDGEIVMPGGTMTVEELTALLNTMPMEITFIDADDTNKYFNEGPKAFKRPTMAIGRKVFSCHPPKIEPLVRRIIGEFKSGQSDKVTIWAEKGGKTMLVTYMAVRNSKGEYVGAAELVQDMDFAKEHFSK